MNKLDKVRILKEKEQFNIKLIEETRQHPCLWKTSLNAYKDVPLKNKSWAEVAHILNSDVETVSTRWRTLRDRYVRERKPKPSGSEGPLQNSTWTLFKLLSFLEDTVAPKETTSSIISLGPPTYAVNYLELSENYYDNSLNLETVSAEDLDVASLSDFGQETMENLVEYNSEEVPKITPAKRSSPKEKIRNKKVKTTCQEKVNELLLKELSSDPEDTLDAFAKYVSGTLRNLNKKKQILARKNISDILFDAELEDCT